MGMSDLQRFGVYPAHTYIITENRTNFLTLPPLP